MISGIDLIDILTDSIDCDRLAELVGKREVKEIGWLILKCADEYEEKHREDDPDDETVARSDVRHDRRVDDALTGA